MRDELVHKDFLLHKCILNNSPDDLDDLTRLDREERHQRLALSYPYIVDAAKRGRYQVLDKLLTLLHENKINFDTKQIGDYSPWLVASRAYESPKRVDNPAKNLQKDKHYPYERRDFAYQQTFSVLRKWSRYYPSLTEIVDPTNRSAVWFALRTLATHYERWNPAVKKHLFYDPCQTDFSGNKLVGAKSTEQCCLDVMILTFLIDPTCDRSGSSIYTFMGKYRLDNPQVYDQLNAAVKTAKEEAERLRKNPHAQKKLTPAMDEVSKKSVETTSNRFSVLPANQRLGSKKSKKLSEAEGAGETSGLYKRRNFQKPKNSFDLPALVNSIIDEKKRQKRLSADYVFPSLMQVYTIIETTLAENELKSKSDFHLFLCELLDESLFIDVRSDQSSEEGCPKIWNMALALFWQPPLDIFLNERHFSTSIEMYFTPELSAIMPK